jgi:hypothetical protein
MTEAFPHSSGGAHPFPGTSNLFREVGISHDRDNLFRLEISKEFDGLDDTCEQQTAPANRRNEYGTLRDEDGSNLSPGRSRIARVGTMLGAGRILLFIVSSIDCEKSCKISDLHTRSSP